MQTKALSSDMSTTPEAAVAAAMAMAGNAAPKGMTSKAVSTNVVEIDGMFIATVIVEFSELEQEIKEEDGKQGEGDKGSAKENNATDAHSLALAAQTAAQAQANNAAPPVPDLNPVEALPQTPIVQSMEQLPDPDHDLLNPEIPDTALGPETLGEEAVTMAEEMMAEFNDNPQDLLVIGQDGISPEQQASNEAHNQKELDAEETRREAAINNAMQAQEELTPEPAS